MDKGARIETFHISTYGCQMNLADSSTLAAILAARGYRRVVSEKDADLIILNTCSVREKAEQRVLGRLGEIYRFKKQKPHLKVAVIGCMAQRLGDELIRRIPHVDFVLGTDRLFELPDVVEGIDGTRPVMTAFGHENMDMITPSKQTPYSGFVTISRGCDNGCTYCIVPYVRGRERTHSPGHVVDGIKQMIDEGVVEVTLLGQNANSYEYNGLDFPGLLVKIVRETNIRRVRFMTSHPKDLSTRLVDIIADEPRVMPHVHLPLQSGSNRVLRMMGRAYSFESYMKIVDYIRKKLDYVSLTTDLMVGFPSETEDEYEETLKAVRSIQYDAAFMFRYSARPGTAAARHSDDVPEAEKIRRLSKLIALQRAISYERNQREVDRISHSLVEGTSRRSEDYYRARTDGNKTVLFKAGDVSVGAVLPIRIAAADSFTLHGEVVEAS